MDQGLIKFKWLSGEVRLLEEILIDSEIVETMAKESYISFVSSILVNSAITDAVRLQWIKEIDVEYQSLMQKIKLMCAEGGDLNETTPINTTGQENCETLSGHGQNTSMAL